MMGRFTGHGGRAMQICPHHREDLAELDRRIRRERNAKQRDRYRAVRLALDGLPTATIMDKLDRSKNFVQRWCYFYRDGGLDALREKPRPGQPVLLPRDQEQALLERVRGQATETDGVCALRGEDVRRILAEQFGVKYSLSGVYELLHRLGLEPLRPRPRHRKNDPQAMQTWRDDAPLLFSKSATRTPTNKSKCGSRTKPASASKAR
jgi:transposase